MHGRALVILRTKHSARVSCDADGCGALGPERLTGLHAVAVARLDGWHAGSLIMCPRHAEAHIASLLSDTPVTRRASASDAPTPVPPPGWGTTSVLTPAIPPAGVGAPATAVEHGQSVPPDWPTSQK